MTRRNHPAAWAQTRCDLVAVITCLLHGEPWPAHVPITAHLTTMLADQLTNALEALAVEREQPAREMWSAHAIRDELDRLTHRQNDNPESNSAT